MIKTYKSPKLTLAEDEVFVFGANSQGFHGFGAAGYASFGETSNVWRQHHYHEWVNGAKGKWNEKGKLGPQVGTEGKSYAIPTVTRAGAKRSIPLDTIKGSIQEFYKFAKSRPHLKFFVAQENTVGLNGYLPTELATIYSGDIPENVYFDEGFAGLLNKSGNETDFITKSHEGLKVIVAGSRSILDYEFIRAAIEESGFNISEIVCGEAKGVDLGGRVYGESQGIPVKSFPASWNDIISKPEKEIGTNKFGKKYWKRAGAFRNQQMADYADALIAITTGSSGTADMIERAKKKSLAIFIKEVN